MKLLLLAFFVAASVATPIPMDEDPSGDAVEVVVNGLAEGEPLDIGHIVDVKVKDIVDGEVAAVASPLHPFTAQGLAEAAAVAEEAAVPEPVLPEPVVPAPTVPEPPAIELPAPIVIPDPEKPEVPAPIVLPEPENPEVVPAPIDATPVDPASVDPVLPEVPTEEVPEVAEALSQPNGEIFDNGIVSVTVNTPEDAGVIATLSSWVSMMVNYVNNGIAYTQQLI